MWGPHLLVEIAELTNLFRVSEYLTQLQNAIRAAYKCEAEHIMTLPVNETLDGVAWDGSLEIFSLRNHQAKRCYAWGGPGDVSNRELTLVLELPPVGSPHSAVKMAMATKAKKQH